MPYAWTQRGHSATTHKEKLIKIGAKEGVSHGRYVAFEMAEGAIQQGVFGDMSRMIAVLRLSHDVLPL